MPENSEILFEQFVKDIRASAELKVQMASTMLSRCESPIERLFLCSYFARTISPQFVQFYDSPDEPWLWSQAIIAADDDFYKVELYAQKTIVLSSVTYRADFLLFVPSKSTKIVIEIDGHDFHEKTKEQAQRDKQRDRELTQAGYKIFRFTGSEVYRDPEKTIDDVYELLASLGKVAA